MSDPTQEPFERDTLLDKPGIVGARWWHRSLVEAQAAMSRRNALRAIALAGGALVGVGALIALVGSAAADDDTRTEKRTALDMQKEYGWSFGATTEALTFDGESKLPFDRAALARLDQDLAPSRADLAPYAVPTLFKSPSAVPARLPQGDAAPVTPLADVLRPVFTPLMDVAYRRGRALASLFAGRDAAAMLVVDLAGPEAVAFAAGAASAFDPVFTFDNWPHPRAVVPAHLTLAAAAYYQPLFARRRGERPAKAPPMLVLDRNRLHAYSDDTTQFDNRHVARMPAARALAGLGVKRVLYVTPTSADTLELDDLNDDFVMYSSSGLDVKMVAANSFAPDASESPTSPGSPDEWPPYYYGGSARSHEGFWLDYPWSPPASQRPPPSPRPGARTPSPPPSPAPPATPTFGKNYRPVPRASAYSSGLSGGSATRPRPEGFGTIPVIVAVATGIVLGAKLGRSGSWNRASGGWGG